MLRIIATESKNLLEFARRAEAFNATEAEPATDYDLAVFWQIIDHAKPLTFIVKAIRKARRERVSKREAMWGSLIAGVNAEVES